MKFEPGPFVFLSMNYLDFKTVVSLITAFSCGVCIAKSTAEREMSNLPPALSGESAPNSQNDKSRPAAFTTYHLSDQLVLRMPQVHQRTIDGHARSRQSTTHTDTIYETKSIEFYFFMPGYSGFTPENQLNEFHEDIVHVVYLQHVGLGAEQPDAAGHYPPNAFKRISDRKNGFIDLDQRETLFGLDCYADRNNDRSQQMCFGPRDHENAEYILLKTMKPPYAKWVKYPLMQARYFTPQYGGVEIVWRAHMKHFPTWHQIDQRVWKFVDEWSVRADK